jgi:hypothetical protein
MKHPRSFPLITTLIAAAALAGPPLLSPTAENPRSGAAYYMGRVGSSWSYATSDKKAEKAKITVDSVENWAARFHVDWGKRSISGTWRVRDSAWVEKLPGHDESIVLPAQLTVGSRWTGPSSIERGDAGKSRFEVISMDAQVELPNGATRYNCVAVLETSEAGDHPFTHFYAPNSGKVAVQGTDGWLLRLLEFRPGRGGGGD